MASLAQTNKHLSTPEQRQRVVRVTIATSSAIEGIRYTPKDVEQAGKEGSKGRGNDRKPRRR